MNRFITIGVIVVVMWGALSFGAVYPWAYWPLIEMCAVLGIAGLVAAGRRALWPPDGLTICFALVTLGLGLQLIPLPYETFVSLTPAADRFLDQQYLRYHLVRPGSHALSITPAATMVTVALVAALSVCFLGLTRSLDVTDVQTLVRRLLVFGVFMAVLAVVQRAAINPEDPLVYGFWRPLHRTVPFGPFINRNHFAGWMVMLAPLAIGYSFAVFRTSPRPRRRTAGAWLTWLMRPEASRFGLSAFAVFTMVASVVLSGSRSGLASLAAAIIVIGVIVVMRERGSVRGLAAVYLTVLVAAAILWVGVGTTIERFALVGEDLPHRWNAWRDTVRVIADFPMFGVGGGAFADVMMQYQSFGRTTFYREAHNDYLEFLAEGGLLVAIPAVIALVLFVRLVLRRLREDDDDPVRPWLRLGAVGGLAGIAMQSLVEFSLQMPGNAVLFVVLAAIATHSVRPEAVLRRRPVPDTRSYF